jgi:phospholipid/cholesterol/gamma-HCH transport system substrate-binding protein
MRGKRNLPVFLGYAVAALFVLGYLGQQMGGEFFLRPTYHVKAVFASAAELVKGDDVTLNGVPVGRVESLTTGDRGTIATFVLHKEFGPLTQDARAVVRPKNLLGEAFVDISKGLGPAMKDWGLIPIERTMTPVELAQVLNVLDPSVRTHLVLLINSLGDALAGRGGDLNQQAIDVRRLADDLAVIAQTLASNQAHLDSLITSLSKILDTLAQYHAEFRALIASWDRLMQALASRETDLQGFFVEQDKVLAIFDAALANGGGAGLHSALAEAPSAIDNTNAYLDRGTNIYGQLVPELPSINTTFDRLASAFSSTDSEGNHYWRVYCSGGCFQPSTGAPGNPGGP